jgi:peptide maturation system protein (TIGR04066 family)
LDFQRFIEPELRLASEKGKKIVCSRSLQPAEREAVSDLEMTCVAYSAYNQAINRNDRIQDIRTPVIYVMSSADFCNQFYLETALNAELQKRQYETLLISSQKENTALGGYSVPSFMFGSEYTENEKVIAFNHYIRYLEAKHLPEVIIIGIPGAAMPYDYRYSSDFGILAYEISEAAKPDFAVLSSLCMPYSEDYFKDIEESLRGRLGIQVDVHTFSLYAHDFYEPSFEKCLAYLSVDEVYAKEMMERAGYENLLDMNNKDGVAAAVDRVIDKLSGGLGQLVT